MIPIEKDKRETNFQQNYARYNSALVRQKASLITGFDAYSFFV